MAGIAVPVEQRTDADGIAGRDEPFFAAVIKDHGELGVQMPEHIQAILVVKGQNDLAVGVRLEGITVRLQFLLDGAEAVKLAVAHHAVIATEEGLHPFRRQAHDGKAAKADKAELGLGHTLVVGTAGCGAQQILGEFFLGQIMSGIAQNTAHLVTLLFFLHQPAKWYKNRQPIRPAFRTNRCLDPRCHLNYPMPKNGIRSLFPYTFTFETLPF